MGWHKLLLLMMQPWKILSRRAIWQEIKLVHSKYSTIIKKVRVSCKAPCQAAVNTNSLLRFSSRTPHDRNPLKTSEYAAVIPGSGCYWMAKGWKLGEYPWELLCTAVSYCVVFPEHPLQLSHTKHSKDRQYDDLIFDLPSVPFNKS